MPIPGLKLPPGLFTPAAGKVLTFNGIIGNGGTNTSSQSIASVPFGTASAGRYVIIGVSAGANGANAPGSITGATIGGVTATVIDGIQNGSAGGMSTAILIAAVPTGTSGTVAITFSANVAYVTLGSWSATGLSSVTANAHGTNTSTFSLGTLAGGFAIAVAGSSSDSTGAGFTWSGLTEQYDSDGGGGTPGTLEDASGAHNAATTGASITVTVTFAAGSRNNMTCASW